VIQKRPGNRSSIERNKQSVKIDFDGESPAAAVRTGTIIIIIGNLGTHVLINMQLHLCAGTTGAHWGDVSQDDSLNTRVSALWKDLEVLRESGKLIGQV